MNERETSQVTESLVNRIDTNNKYGNEDLTDWLVRKLELVEGETILEIGCGTGKHLIEFARILSQPYSCAGIDISRSSLQKAEFTARNKGLSIDWQCESMDSLPLNLYDGKLYKSIMFIYSLYYSKHPLQTLAKATKFMDKDGRLVVMGPYLDNNREWLLFLGQFMPLPEEATKSTPTFMYDYVLKFAYTFFANVTMQRFINTIEIKNAEDLRKYWISCIYYLEEYDELFDEHASKFFLNNNTFRYSKVGLLVMMKDKLF